MLGSRMTNADEDEVEEELAALEAEVSGVPTTVELPSVPDKQPPAQIIEASEPEPAHESPREARQMVAA